MCGVQAGAGGVHGAWSLCAAQCVTPVTKEEKDAAHKKAAATQRANAAKRSPCLQCGPACKDRIKSQGIARGRRLSVRREAHP